MKCMHIINIAVFSITVADGGVARHSNAEMVEFTVGVLGSGQVRFFICVWLKHLLLCANKFLPQCSCVQTRADPAAA